MSFKKILILVVVLAVAGVLYIFLERSGGPAVEDALPLTPREAKFEYYGWFAVDYAEATPALKRLRAYTNTAFAYMPEQTKVLKEVGFPHIVYVFNADDVVAQLVEEENIQVPEIMIPYEGKEYPSGIKDYPNAISGFRKKFFALYRTRLEELKNSFEALDSLEAVDVFSLADEPALHRNVYLDQAFLNQMVADFKQVFPGKKTLMAFAQNPDPAGNPYPGTGTHLAPPPALDMVVVDPYIDSTKVSCEREKVRSWLYENNPISNITWAKQFGKPIIVAGDAQLRNGEPIDFCYQQAIFDILGGDPAVRGLIWFAYDKSYQEGELSGAANNPAFVHMIEGLGN